MQRDAQDSLIIYWLGWTETRKKTISQNIITSLFCFLGTPIFQHVTI